jgi:hypothetical protein
VRYISRRQIEAYGNICPACLHRYQGFNLTLALFLGREYSSKSEGRGHIYPARLTHAHDLGEGWAVPTQALCGSTRGLIVDLRYLASHEELTHVTVLRAITRLFPQLRNRVLNAGLMASLKLNPTAVVMAAVLAKEAEPW